MNRPTDEQLAIWRDHVHNTTLPILEPEEVILSLFAEIDALRIAIAEHHIQKADDRCIEDDDRLYVAAGLPPCDRHVGNKEEMLESCRRFIENRCEGGVWPSYRELEARCRQLGEEVAALHKNADEVGKALLSGEPVMVTQYPAQITD
jgi:hypothetical protein